MWAVWWGETVPLQTHLTIVQHRSHFSGCYVNHNTLLSMAVLSWQSEFGFFERSSQEVVRIKSHHLTINNNHFIGGPGRSRFNRAFPETTGKRCASERASECVTIRFFEQVSQVSQALSPAAVNQHSRALKPTRCLTAPQKTNSLPSASRSTLLCVPVRLYPASPGATCRELFANAK